jgi:hypothetical protein
MLLNRLQGKTRRRQVVASLRRERAHLCSLLAQRGLSLVGWSIRRTPPAMKATASGRGLVGGTSQSENLVPVRKPQGTVPNLRRLRSKLGLSPLWAVFGSALSPQRPSPAR